MSRKKKILLNWWYDRADLMAPFVRLKEEIDFTLIFYKTPNGDEKPSDFPVIYWDDFPTPYHLLIEVKPDEVVFINIEDRPHQIALNIACRQLNISTVICDHGLRGADNGASPKFSFAQNKQKTLWFVLSCLASSNFKFLPLLLKLAYYKLAGSGKGRVSPNLKKLRLAQRYICYTPNSSRYLIERDGAKPEQFTITGNPALDPYFGHSVSVSNRGNGYYLLIDQPFVKNKFNNNLLSATEKNAFLIKLASFCKSQGQRLLVKLHPDDFGQDYYIQHPSVEFVEEGDIISLMTNSSGVFGFYSTLLIPAIYYKKCFVFRIEELPIQTLWANLGVVKLLDFFSFEPEDLDFDNLTITPEQMKDFVDIFIYKPDGKAFQRLRSALLQDK